MATPGLPNQNHHVNDRCQRQGSQKRRVDDVITRDGLTFLTNRCVCIPLSVLHPNIDQKMLYSTEICWGFAKQKDCLLRQVHGKTVGDHAQPKLQISDNSHNPKRNVSLHLPLQRPSLPSQLNWHVRSLASMSCSQLPTKLFQLQVTNQRASKHKRKRLLGTLSGPHPICASYTSSTPTSC